MRSNRISCSETQTPKERKLKPMKTNNLKAAFLLCAGAALVTLAGCVPGEAEFTLKTSQLRKALKGELAQISVCERMSTPLSNAYDKVAFGVHSNRLAVVKAMVADLAADPVLGLKDGRCAGDQLHICVEEPSGALPCVRMEAQIAVALGTASVLTNAVRNHLLGELCALQIDPLTGRIGHSEIGNTEPLNARQHAFIAAAKCRQDLTVTLFGNSEGAELQAVNVSLLAAALPTWFRNLSCTVVGDADEPLYVIADDVKVNGEPKSHFEGYVRQGESLRFELDKRKHNRDGGMRFLLAKPAP